MCNDNALTFREITKRYRNFTLQSISGSVLPARIVALVGKNGAGKTTLLKIASGLIPTDSGKVMLGDTVVADGMHPMSMEMRSIVGYLPEEQVFYEWMTVDGILSFCASLLPRWQQNRAEDLVSECELRREESVGELSKGMRVKLGLVIALSSSPKALILDEPLSGLDPLFRAAIMAQIRDLVTRSQCCCLISSHDLEDVKKISDAIWVLKEGALSLKVQCTAPGVWESNGEYIENLFERACAAM